MNGPFYTNKLLIADYSYLFSKKGEKCGNEIRLPIFSEILKENNKKVLNTQKPNTKKLNKTFHKFLNIKCLEESKSQIEKDNEEKTKFRQWKKSS